MTAITLDHLSGGRFILGLGVSGPQVVEGWYGQAYAKPLARTREYIEIVRRIIARDEPVEFAGEHYAMPLEGGTGLGKPLKSIVRPLRTDIPIYLGAEGPKNVALAAEIADGWLPMFFSPKADEVYRAALAEGFARPGARRTPDDFEVACVVPTIPGDDIEACADLLRPNLALYIGGMGAATATSTRTCSSGSATRPSARRSRRRTSTVARPTPPPRCPTAMVEDVYLRRPAREDPRRPRALARELRHHAAGGRAAGGPPPDRRDRGLTAGPRRAGGRRPDPAGPRANRGSSGLLEGLGGRAGAHQVAVAVAAVDAADRRPVLGRAAGAATG